MSLLHPKKKTQKRTAPLQESLKSKVVAASGQRLARAAAVLDSGIQITVRSGNNRDQLTNIRFGSCDVVVSGVNGSKTRVTENEICNEFKIRNESGHETQVDEKLKNRIK